MEIADEDDDVQFEEVEVESDDDDEEEEDLEKTLRNLKKSKDAEKLDANGNPKDAENQSSKPRSEASVQRYLGKPIACSCHISGS